LPIVPLALTMTSAKDLLKRLVELLFQALAFLARALWMTVLADRCFRLEWQYRTTAPHLISAVAPLTARPVGDGSKVTWGKRRCEQNDRLRCSPSSAYGYSNVLLHRAQPVTFDRRKGNGRQALGT
jgi:hypothetical protein